MKYTQPKPIGKGTFGDVFEAIDKKGNKIAIKKVIQDPNYKNRELAILQKLNHPNCLRIYDHFITTERTNQKKDVIFLHIVSELFPMDLLKFTKKNPHIPDSLIKVFSYQIFSGLAYLHSLNICHRVIKPKNILINPETGSLQICDFGSAKQIDSGTISISYIATRSYRAPELLYDNDKYSFPIDVWAASCVIMEMFRGGKLFFSASKNEEMISLVADLIGSPTQQDLIALGAQKTYDGGIKKRMPISQFLPKGVDPDLIQILESIFVYNPNQRATAKQCLESPYYDDIRNNRVILPNGKPFVLPQ